MTVRNKTQSGGERDVLLFMNLQKTIKPQDKIAQRGINRKLQNKPQINTACSRFLSASLNVSTRLLSACILYQVGSPAAQYPIHYWLS